LRFKIPLANNEEYLLNWWPSEYLYREHDYEYCVAADIQSENEIMMGGTLIRQHAFVFDIENRKVGIAHAKCSHNPHQVMNILDLASEG